MTSTQYSALLEDPLTYVVSPKTTATARRPAGGGEEEGLELDGDLSVSRVRFWAVGVFALVSVMQNVVWICFSVIQDSTQDYYNLPNANPINLLVGLGALIYCPFVFVSTAMLDRVGLRRTLMAGTLFMAAGAATRLLSLLHGQWSWVLVGQILNGLAGPVVMGAPAHLSGMFFPEGERATATAVAWLAQPVGLSVGFLIGPSLVSTGKDIPTLLWVEAIAGAVLLAVVVLSFPDAPKRAPSRSAQCERTTGGASKEGCREMMRHIMRPSFIALGLVWGVSGGVIVGWQTLLDLFLDVQLQVFTSVQVGAGGGGVGGEGE